MGSQPLLAVSYLTAWNMLQTNGVSKREKDPCLWRIEWSRNGNYPAPAKALDTTVITTASGNSKHDFAEKASAGSVIGNNDRHC